MQWIDFDSDNNQPMEINYIYSTDEANEIEKYKRKKCRRKNKKEKETNFIFLAKHKDSNRTLCNLIEVTCPYEWQTF